MKATFYAVLDLKGLVRTTKTEPRLEPGQRAVVVQLQMPDSAFEPDALPLAFLDVPEGAVRRPSPEVLLMALQDEDEKEVADHA